jgi:prepilin-type N-terminal cleavage/methylation domain-containing protein
VLSTPWEHVDQSASRRGESGFTLIELVIVTLVIPIIIGAITLALISVFSLQGGTVNRISDSGDAQIVSANFEKDVQSAALITTDGTSSSPAPCETSVEVTNGNQQIIGLQWGSGQTEVSYVEVAVGSGSTSSNEMVRNTCQKGSTMPVSSSVVADDLPTGQQATVTCATTATAQCSGTTNVANSWIPAADAVSVTLNITAPKSSYPYTLVAVPGASSPASAASTVATPNSGCGFATPGTGTYASTLCFVDFSAYNGTPTPCPGSPTLQLISAPISNTPYTMTFCLSVTGVSADAHSIPTYFSPPTSEAFLGNNGFYTGIPGDPAIYQTGSGTTTVAITNIRVLDSNGNPATGWQLVTGDAESTDSGESLTWTIPENPGPVLNLLANSPSSPYGNACANTTFPSGVDLTGLGTQSVTCAANVSSDKTGTVMLEATTPTSLTVVMVGNGLQAMFLGLLLP